MDRSNHRIGFLNIVLLLLTGAAVFFTARFGSSVAGQVATIFWGVGILYSILGYFQMRLEYREQVERMEFDELVKSKASASLFKEEGENFPAQHSREQFERWFVPIITLLIAIAEGLAAVWLWRWLKLTTFPPVKGSMVPPALFGLFALLLFLFGKYAIAVARLKKDRLLRPGSTAVLMCAYLAAFLAIGLGLVVGGVYGRLDIYLARALVILLGLLALEAVVSLIFEMYRPRTRIRPVRTVYESRISSLFAEPESLFTTAAQALDYQFGFKVSETWVYRFFQKTFAWLLLLQLAVLLLSTTVVFIGPGEQGLKERLGKPVGANNVLEPGPHWKLPWPIDRVHRFRTREIQSFNVGFVPDPKKEKSEKTILWTVGHYQQEFNLLVASKEAPESVNTNAPSSQGVSLLTVSIPVQYQITNLVQWAYKHTSAGSMLEKVATREVVLYLVGVDFFEIMSFGRAAAGQELLRRIQTRANELELGVKIVFVGLQDIHPPVKVAPSFEEVVGMSQLNQARIRAAEGYRAKEIPLAQARAQEIIRSAETEKIRRTSSAAAQAAQFTNQISAYQAAPEIFRYRSYLQTLTRGGANSRKFIVTSTNSEQVITLNLEDKIRPDLEGIVVPPKR